MGHKRSEDYIKGYRFARGVWSRGGYLYDTPERMRAMAYRTTVAGMGTEFQSGFLAYCDNNL